MTIKEIKEIVEEARQLLIENFKNEYDRSPKEDELIKYVNKIYKEGMESDILGDLMIEELEYPEDFGKPLLIFAASTD
jgi:hypothetical protein